MDPFKYFHIPTLKILHGPRERCLTLFLRQDELGGESVLGVWYGMVQQTDTSHHPPGLLHVPGGVAGVAVDLLALGHLGPGPDPHHGPALHHDLVYLLVQHVGPAVDGGQTGEPLTRTTLISLSM